jgi:hypothetical protein
MKRPLANIRPLGPFVHGDISVNTVDASELEKLIEDN